MSYDHADDHPARQAGFTLIEVLISILLFGIIAAVCYQGLGAVMMARERVTLENGKLRSVALALTRLEVDLGSLVEHPVHDVAGPLQPASLVGNPVYRAEEASLMFTREGDRDADGNPGAPARVGYRLREGTLERLAWPVLDAAPRVQAQAAPLLEGVSNVEFAYLSADGQQGPIWPRGTTAAGTPSSAPAAISIRLTLSDGTQLSRLFALSAPGVQ
jgi:general secretion pathway protein J